MKPDTASLWVAARRFEAVLRKDAGAFSFAPLSDIYRRLGLLEEALEAARKGCALHPDFASGQLSLAKSALECGFKSEAVTALEAVVRITPENIEAQRLLADLYTAEGKTAAAHYCLAVAESLDMEFQEPVSPPPMTAEALPEEELLDEDILELSDELIDVETSADATDHFAASPERPSLGDMVNRAEPFLMEMPPPFYPEEPAAVEESSPMVSATIAELYVSQGFPDKGAAVYRELLSVDPLNEEYGQRLAELTQPVTQPVVERREVQPDGLLDRLQEWLGNIGRVRECRTRNL